jgi:hypothetical protein
MYQVTLTTLPSGISFILSCLIGQEFAVMKKQLKRGRGKNINESAVKRKHKHKKKTEAQLKKILVRTR